MKGKSSVLKMIQNKKIAIFGFGKEGVSAANFLGRKNQIVIIDEKTKDKIDDVFFTNLKVKNCDFYFGSFPKDQNFDFVIRSPGVRPDHPKLRTLISKGATLTSATKIFFDQCPAKIIGVTGTKGKGTTSTLIYEMLKSAKKKVHLAGNIGKPMLNILNDLDQESLVVLELSSFQLFDLTKSPRISVVLMITTEHLDWHKDNNEYRDSKINIVSHQTASDYAVINEDYEISKNFSDKTKSRIYFFSTNKKTNGAYLLDDDIVSEINGFEKICKISDVRLPGKHNLQNILASISVAKILNIDRRLITNVLKTFKGLKHRLQLVDEINGVKYFNDSFSTTPETTIAAIEAFQNPKILILGGSSKKSDFTNLAQKINRDKTIKALILIGLEGPRIKEYLDQAGGFGGKITEGAKNMKEVVNFALNLSEVGDVVLLSPACASFGMFKNYQDRGEQYIKFVKSIKA